MVQKTKGKFRVQVRVAGEVRGHVWTRKGDALIEERELMHERELIRGGLELPAKNVLLLDYSREWLKARKKKRPRSTWSKDESRLRLYILPRFGARALGLIKIAEWKAFFEDLLDVEELSPATHNRVRATLHRLYKEAMQDGKAVQNPISTIALLSERKKTKPRDHWESAEDVDAYLEEMKQEGEGHWLLALILLNTGMRRGEGIGLVNTDVHLQQGLLRVHQTYDVTESEIVERTKAGEGVVRWVPITAPLRAALEARTVVNPSWPVCHRGKGEPISPWTFRDAHDRAIARAGVKRIEIREMRRTYATHFRNGGGSKEALKEILGHSSQLVTEGYLGESPEFLKQQANVVQFGGMSRQRHTRTGLGEGA